MNNRHTVFSFITPEEYEKVAVIAQLAAENLIERLKLVRLQPEVILDVGCGTGFAINLLKSRYPNATIIALDNEETMLQFVQRNIPTMNFICSQAEMMCLKSHSVDLIFSNLLLPWCSDWEKILNEWLRVLRPGGLLMFSCFGPDTLRELGDCFFLTTKDMHDIGDNLARKRFCDAVMDNEKITVTYKDSLKLTNELKMSGMLSRDQSLIEHHCSLTYELIYGHAWGAALKKLSTSEEDGVFRIPLSHLRRREK